MYNIYIYMYHASTFIYIHVINHIPIISTHIIILYTLNVKQYSYIIQCYTIFMPWPVAYLQIYTIKKYSIVSSLSPWRILPSTSLSSFGSAPRDSSIDCVVHEVSPGSCGGTKGGAWIRRLAKLKLTAFKGDVFFFFGMDGCGWERVILLWNV